MIVRKESIENDHNWYPSMGEQFWKDNFRNGHYHAVCDSSTGDCSIHYDNDDPHESLTSLVKHLLGNNKVQLLIGAALADEILCNGKYRKKVMRTLFK